MRPPTRSSSTSPTKIRWNPAIVGQALACAELQLRRAKRWHRYLPALMLLAVTTLCLGESGADVWGPDVRRVGVRLACLCKTCVETVGTCPMLQCHYSSPARQRIQQMAKVGVSDDDMVKVFVKENGIQALSVPPNEGFNSMVWIMPWAAAALGLCAIAWYVKRHSKPQPLQELPASTTDRFHSELDDFGKDMADHD